MATERIKLFEADIDVEGVVKRSQELSQELSKLRLEQQKLKATVGESSEEYIKNDAALKKVSAEYRNNQKIVTNLTGDNNKLLTVEQKMTMALDKQVLSIDNAVKNNKELREIRNQVNAETDEGRKAIEELNKKIDENTAFIKQNTDSFSQQKMEIGNYTKGIDDAFGGLGRFVSMSQEAGGASKVLSGALVRTGKAIWGVTKASLAFIATPVGAIVAALAVVFGLVKNAMNRSEDATDKLTKAFAPLTSIVDMLLRALQPLGEFLVDGIVNALELAEIAFQKVLGALSAALRFLGFESAAAAIDGFSESVQNATRETRELAQLQIDLTNAERDLKKSIIDSRREVEKLRQARDNETLSIRERIQAADELSAKLREQAEEERKVAEMALEEIERRIKIYGETTELIDEQVAAYERLQNALLRIDKEETSAQRKRQSLLKQEEDQRKQAFDLILKRQDKEIELYIASQGVKAKTMQEELKIAEDVFEKRLALEKRKLATGKITQEEYKLFVLKSETELHKQRAEIAIANAKRELNNFIETNQSKIESSKVLTDELVDEEIRRLIAISEQREKFEKEQFEKGLINEQEYQDNILAIKQETLDREKSLKDQFDKQRKADELLRQEMELAEELERLEIEGATKYELEQERLLLQHEMDVQRLEEQREQGLITEQEYLNRRKELDNDLTENLKSNQEAVSENKIALAQMTLSNIAAIVGKESALGKAVAIAQATIDTYKAAVAAYAAGVSVGGPAGLVLGPVSAALAVGAGMANIKKIASTKPPKAERGMAIDIGGKRHSAGGTKFYGEDGTAFEAEKGEKMFILSRQASAALAPLLSDINQQYGGVSLAKSSTYLSSGGQVLRAGMNKINPDQLAQMVKEGVREGSLEGTLSGSLEGSRQGSMEGSSRGTYSGIVDKETNEIIEKNNIGL